MAGRAWGRPAGLGAARVTCRGLTSGLGCPARRWPTCWPWPRAAAGDPASPPDPVPDRAILEHVADPGAGSSVAGAGRAAGIASPIGQMTAGLRVLAQVGDPREDTQRGLISAAQAEAVTGLYGRAASDRVIIERASALEARLRALETLGSAPVPAAAEPAAGGGRWTGRRRVRQPGARGLRHRGPHPPAPPGPSRAGRGGTRSAWPAPRRSAAELIDRLADACEATRTGLVVAYRSISAARRAAARPWERGGGVDAPGQRRGRQGGQRADRRRSTVSC